MITSPNMSLIEWNLINDPFSSTQLQQNFSLIDSHNHTIGKGVQIPTGGIQNNAITPNLIAPSAVGSSQIANGAVGTNQIAPGAVTANQIAANAITTSQLANASVTAAKLASIFLSVNSVMGAVPWSIQWGQLNPGVQAGGNYTDFINLASAWTTAHGVFFCIGTNVNSLNAFSIQSCDVQSLSQGYVAYNVGSTGNIYLTWLSIGY